MILGNRVSILNLFIYFLSSCAVIFLTMPVHEFAHAFAATKLGDPTPKYQGRLSLNPFHHIDYFGALCILLFGFGWAKPVSINSRNFDNPKRDMALTALAGPVSNLIVAFLVLFLTNFIFFLYNILQIGFLVYIAFFFGYIASINIHLAVFNLIPIPPLDGSRLLCAILPDSIYYRIMQYERFLFLIVLVLCYTGVLGGPLSTISNLIYNFFNTVTGFVFGY
ncbi:MAG: site-2 protease family protein [Clostridia bacterium]|nr:site-2 protease family protein [Clostridia bacterium]